MYIGKGTVLQSSNDLGSFILQKNNLNLKTYHLYKVLYDFLIIDSKSDFKLTKSNIVDLITNQKKKKIRMIFILEDLVA